MPPIFEPDLGWPFAITPGFPGPPGAMAAPPAPGAGAAGFRLIGTTGGELSSGGCCLQAPVPSASKPSPVIAINLCVCLSNVMFPCSCRAYGLAGNPTQAPRLSPAFAVLERAPFAAAAAHRHAHSAAAHRHAHHSAHATAAAAGRTGWVNLWIFGRRRSWRYYIHLKRIP